LPWRDHQDHQPIRPEGALLQVFCFLNPSRNLGPTSYICFPYKFRRIIRKIVVLLSIPIYKRIMFVCRSSCLVPPSYYSISICPRCFSCSNLNYHLYAYSSICFHFVMLAFSVFICWAEKVCVGSMRAINCNAISSLQRTSTIQLQRTSTIQLRTTQI
jgi:hypothetical protein